MHASLLGRTTKRIHPLPNTTATVTHENTREADRGGAARDVAAAADDRPVLESRRRRLRAYLRHNGERICRDTAVALTWALAMTLVAQELGLPRWVQYFLTFVGVVIYTRATTPWSRPYTSPDDLESAATAGRLQEPEQRHE